jgi:hypothetical protein
VRYQTQGRIRIKTYFDGELFKGEQTSEFHLMQQGLADFAIGSTINWSPQVKELNLFVLPFLFSTYRQVDAVQSGEPGKRLFRLIAQSGVVPLGWGENGFRDITNGKRPIRRPEDLHGLKIRIVGIPLLHQTFEALGAEPVAINWNDAQAAFRTNGCVLGLTWDSTGSNLAADGFGFLAPKEGAFAWNQGFFLLKNAKNVEQAHEWAKWISSPEGAAAWASAFKANPVGNGAIDGI